MIEKLTTACSKVFPLTTLRDIFNLPTFDQMVVCLEEVKDCMIQARATNDLMIDLLAKKGIAVDKAFEWPELLEWKDDGNGEVCTAYAGPDGKELFAMKASRDPANGQGSEADSETSALRERYKKDKILTEDEWKDLIFDAMAKMEMERNEARREARNHLHGESEAMKTCRDCRWCGPECFCFVGKNPHTASDFCDVCNGATMIPSMFPDGDVMNTRCPKCNFPHNDLVEQPPGRGTPTTHKPN